MKNIDIDIHDSNITKKGINAIIDFYDLLSINKCIYPDGIAFVTGIESPFLNVFFDFRAVKKNSSTFINSVSEFFDEYKVPWGWFITPTDRDNDLIQNGFAHLEESPAMYFNLKNIVTTSVTDFITIYEATDENDLLLWIQPVNDGFQVKEGDDSYLKLNTEILKKGTKKLRHFFAYYKEELAASASLFLSDDAVMLHNLATKSDIRNYGVASALTLHLMNLAKKIGFEHCFLDSSEEAFNLYKRLGFKVYSSTLIYSKTC